MNTRIDYNYRNAEGLVLNESVVIDGQLQLAHIIMFLNHGTEFIASQVEMPALNGKDIDVDGPWHKMLDLVLTTDEPTMNLTAVELTESFRAAHKAGWNEMLFFEEIAQQAAAAANGFFLREPKELSHLTDLMVRLQSDEHGIADTKHFNLENALDKIIELYLEVLKLDDGTERTIGLVIYPAEKETVLTVFRGHFSKNSLKVLRNDLEWACSELGIGEPQLVKNSKTGVECAYNDSNNFDILQSFLKQKELLVY